MGVMQCQEELIWLCVAMPVSLSYCYLLPIAFCLSVLPLGSASWVLPVDPVRRPCHQVLPFASAASLQVLLMSAARQCSLNKFLT